MRLRRWAWWTAGFLAFPLAGIAGGAVAGPVAGVGSALLGGAVTGLVLGAGQSLVARAADRGAARPGPVRAARWVPASTVGMAVGLAAGGAAVGFGTTLPDLALMGLLTGIPLGVAQAAALDVPRRWIWALTTPLLWALGWTVTTVVGVDVETQYTIFGSTGAVTVSALSGLVLSWMEGRR